MTVSVVADSEESGLVCVQCQPFQLPGLLLSSFGALLHTRVTFKFRRQSVRSGRLVVSPVLRLEPADSPSCTYLPEMNVLGNWFCSLHMHCSDRNEQIRLDTSGKPICLTTERAIQCFEARKYPSQRSLIVTQRKQAPALNIHNGFRNTSPSHAGPLTLLAMYVRRARVIQLAVC